MEAEREAADLQKCAFLRGRVGEVFEATMTGASPFGLWLTLDDHFVEVTLQLADDGQYTLIKDDDAVEGEVQEWYDFLDAHAVPPQDYGAHDWYTAVANQLDLEAYMDWMFLNILGAAADNGWVNNVALLKTDDGRWRYIMWDEEGLLNEANLKKANLKAADLSKADLSKADLSEADVTDEQLARAWLLTGATMPDGAKHD